MSQCLPLDDSDIHVNPERSFGGTNGDPPSEASKLRKRGSGGLPRKISKTYIANGAIYVIPELYRVDAAGGRGSVTKINSRWRRLPRV